MEKYEFLTVYKVMGFDETIWKFGIYPTELIQWLNNAPFAHKENDGFVIDKPADALMSLSVIGYELKSTTLYERTLEATTEIFYFQRKTD